jgi:hypothetical protein
MKLKNYDKVFERKIKLLELNKTPEEKEFQKKNCCYIFLSSNNYIDFWIKISNDKNKIDYNLLNSMYDKTLNKIIKNY